MKEKSYYFTFKEFILPCVLGTFVEWMDYSLFALMAPFLGILIFKSKSAEQAIFTSILIMNLSLLIRPFGGAFFASLGDRIGRRITLIITISIMTLSIFCTGLIPSYAEKSFLSTMLFCLFAFANGFSAGGELPTVQTLLYEVGNVKNRVLTSSFSFFAVSLGILVGSLAISFTLFHTFGSSFINKHLWRVPFIICGSLGGLTYFLRKKLHESPEFKRIVAHNEIMRRPVWDTIRNHSGSLIRAILTTYPFLMIFNLYGYFMPIYLKEARELSSFVVLNYTLFLMVISLICIPLWSIIAQKIGVLKVQRTALILLLGLTYPCYQMLWQTPTIWTHLFQAFIAIIMCAYTAPMPAILASFFTTNHRCSGLSLSINIVLALIVGPSILLLHTLIKKQGLELLPCYYTLFLLLLAFVMSFFYKHTQNSLPLKGN